MKQTTTWSCGKPFSAVPSQICPLMCTRSISVQREFSLLFSCHLQLHNFRGRGETGDEKIRLPNLTSTYYVTVKNFFQHIRPESGDSGEDASSSVADGRESSWAQAALLLYSCWRIGLGLSLTVKVLLRVQLSLTNLRCCHIIVDNWWVQQTAVQGWQRFC